MPDPARPPRARRWRNAAARWWGAALVLLVIVVTIGLPLVGQGSLHAADTLQTLDPWAQQADPSFRPDNGTVSDTVDAVAPVRLSIAARARDGDLALWSSTQGGGAPLLGVPNTAMLSPLSLPWWLAPGWWAPALAKALQMLVAASGLFLLSRQLGLSRGAAAVGALGFVNAGHLVVWTTWPQSNVAALVPWLFLAVERAIASPRWVDAWPVPLVGAVMWLEGFPALTLWAHVFAGAYAVMRARPLRRVGGLVAGHGAPDTHNSGRLERLGRLLGRFWRSGLGRASAVAGAMLVGVGIAAVQLVPFAIRLGELDTSGRAAKAADALPWESAATLVAPRVLGQSGAGVWYGPRNEVELQAFVGVVVVLLTIVAIVGSRHLRVASRAWLAFAVTASVAVGALIWGGGDFQDSVQSLPLIGGNQTGRLRGLLAFFLAGSAACGFEVLLQTGRERLVQRLALVLVGVGVVAAALAPAFSEAVALATDAGRGEFVRGALAWPAVVLLAGVLAVAVASASRGVVRVVALAVLPLLLVAEATSFARGFLPRIDTDHFYPRTVAHDVVSNLVGGDRFAVGGLALYPGTTTAYGLRSLTAHASMPSPWKKLLLDADPEAFERNSTFPILGSTIEVASSPALDVLGASHFVTSMDDPVLGRRVGEFRPGDDLPATVRTTASNSTSGPRLRGVHGVDVHRDVLAGLVDHSSPVTLTAWIEDAAGVRQAEGSRRLTGREGGEWLSVPLAPLAPNRDRHPSAGRLMVALTLRTPGSGGLTVAAAPDLRLRPVMIGDQGLRVVAAPGVVVYERPDARPRVRAETSTGIWLPNVEVTTTLDTDDDLAVTIDAPAGGVTLVVADALSGGHLARVDGEQVEVVAAHDALVGIPVPAGTHEVTLTWQPEGLRPAAAVTVLSLAGVLLVAALATRRREDDDHAEFAGDSGQVVGAEVFEQG